MSKENVQAIFKQAPEDIQKLVLKVIDAENNKIHFKKPHGIKEDIADVVKEVIK
jgi:hypothetical protein